MNASESPTTLGQRIYLALNLVVVCAIVWGLRADRTVWMVLPLAVFILAVVVANWKTTVNGEPEWHDYR